MKNKYLIAAAITGIVFSVCGFAIFNHNIGEVLNHAKLASASDRSLVLNSGSIDGLTDSYSNGVFSVATIDNNEVAFNYNYGKYSANNLIELGSNQEGNGNHTKYYVGNTDPITGSTEISVSFSGSPYLMLYGSIDNTNFYRLDLFTNGEDAHLTTSKGLGYFYYRFVNASQNSEACTINHIEFSYTCSGYNDEVSDFSNADTINICEPAVGSYEVDGTYFKNEFNSSKSLHIMCDTSGSATQANFVIEFGETIAPTIAKHLVIELYFDLKDNTSVNSKKYGRLMVYYAKAATTHGTNSSQLQINNGTTWTKGTFYGSELFKEGEAVKGLYLRFQYINDAHIDQIRISLDSNYPEFAEPVVTPDTNDLAVASNVVSPLSKNGDKYVAKDVANPVYNEQGLDESTSSLAFVATYTATYTTASIKLKDEGNYDIVDNAGMKVSFYVNYSKAYTDGGKTIVDYATKLGITLARDDGNYVFYESSKLNNHVIGTTVIDKGDGWYYYEYNVSDFGTVLTRSDQPDTTTFNLLYLQWAESKITNEIIGSKIVIDRLSIA